jgi:RNA polymerase sigma factor (TIGR02999 family)
LVYDQLRAMAGGYFKAQPASHTLQPTALVNEAYLKLVGSEQGWKSRPHFCAVAATAMRQILMDHARAKRRAKRAGHVVDVTIDDLATPGGTPLDLVALDDAMAKLAQMQERSARIVELRFFGGLTNPEISQVMGVSTATAVCRSLPVLARHSAWSLKNTCSGFSMRHSESVSFAYRGPTRRNGRTG